MKRPREGTCTGCGADYSSWTRGCATCTERQYKRARRSGDPVLLARHHRQAQDIAYEGWRRGGLSQRECYRVRGKFARRPQ